MDTSALETALLEAHARSDGDRLAGLYVRAADAAEARGDVDAACFFLTQAWVFALQGDASAEASIRSRLVRHGRL